MLKLTVGVTTSSSPASIVLQDLMFDSSCLDIFALKMMSILQRSIRSSEICPTVGCVGQAGTLDPIRVKRRQRYYRPASTIP